MKSFIIFLTMFVTILGPSLLVLGGVLGVPITLCVLSARGKKLTAKVILLSIAAVLCLPVVAEALAIVTLLILFQLFGRG